MRKKNINYAIWSFALLTMLSSCTPNPFNNIRIEEKNVGPYYFVMTEYFGDYQQTQALRDSVARKLKTRGVIADEYFGIFYTSPINVTTTAELHSIIGCILPPQDTLRKRELMRRGYRIEKMGETRSIVAEFQYEKEFPVLEGIEDIYTAFAFYVSQKNYEMKPLVITYGKNKVVYSMEIIP